MEEEKDVEMEYEDSPDVSPDISPDVSSDEDSGELDDRVDKLRKEVDANPYTYELHVQLINICKELEYFPALRSAREKMSELFPLTPELWLDWLNQERSSAKTAEQRKEVAALFEKALKDYHSIEVWLEYLTFSIENAVAVWNDDAVSECRIIFETAITCVGIHVDRGCSIWTVYRTFEDVYLNDMKKHRSSEDVKKQEERMYNLYKRELSIPLLFMHQTYSKLHSMEFKEYNPDMSAVDYSYNKALKKLEQLEPHECALKDSEPPHYEQYKQYIEFEKQGGEPIRVQSIYERAIIDNCLKEDLWLDYTKYVDQVIKIKDISIPLYERAVRNCPWCAQLWVSYARSLERFGEEHSKIIGVLETALNMGFTKAEDFKELWLSYVGYLRRKIDKETSESSSGESNLEAISDVYDRAVTQMKHYFWGSESEYIILKSWIVFTAKYKKDVENCRKLWKELMDHGHKEAVRVWLDVANFEKLFGDAAHYRKTLFSAISSVSDWQETFVDLLITFENEEGTLESLEKTLAKCDLQMKQVNEKRLKKLEEESNSYRDDKKRSPAKRQQKFQRGDDLSPKPPIKMDSEGFKIPPPPPDRAPSPVNNRQPESSVEPEVRKRKPEEDGRTVDKKKRKVEKLEVHGESVKHDPSKDDRTAFVSNLSYNINEDEIKEIFCKIGEIEEVRLVKDYKGRSKGFCYVVYKSQEHAVKALSLDRKPIDGRPALVSPCEDKRNNPLQPKFKFATGLERNKLFIKNLPHSTTKEDLETMFNEFGAVKDVRLVTYRNGHSKGLAYVEFHNEACASKAVLEMDGRTLGDHVLSVAISNPPPRKPRKEGVSIADSLGGGGGATRGPRGRGRTQLSFVPRTVVRGVQQKKGAVPNGSSPAPDSAPKPMSNSDFARMLHK